MKVSVIIPVYNAAKYVEAAVNSALMQPEAGEVIIVEDGSEDHSLDVCRALEAKDDRIRLFQHPGGVNKGAGASRNLGMDKATMDWIAFLDADDYYLEGRFERACQFLSAHPEYDGVAEAIGAKYEDEEGKVQYLDHLGLPLKTEEAQLVTGMSIESGGHDLFEEILLAKNGHVSIVGIICKKSVAKHIYFKEDFPIVQDTNFIMLLLYFFNIKAFDKSTIVTVRRIHSGNRWNRSLKRRLYFYSLHIMELYNTIDHHTLSKRAAKKLTWAYVRSYTPQYFQTNNKVLKLYYGSLGYLQLMVTNPYLLKKAYF